MLWLRIKISLRTIVEEMKINKSTKYPNSRNQCFHGAGDISEKGGGEVDREICRFLKSNQMVGATQSFVSKRFFDECLSPALLVQTFEFCMNCFCSWDYRGTSEGNRPQTQVVLKILSAYFQAAKIWKDISREQKWQWTECFLFFSCWLVPSLSEWRFPTCPLAKVSSFSPYKTNPPSPLLLQPEQRESSFSHLKPN